MALSSDPASHYPIPSSFCFSYHPFFLIYLCIAWDLTSLVTCILSLKIVNLSTCQMRMRLARSFESASVQRNHSEFTGCSGHWALSHQASSSVFNVQRSPIMVSSYICSCPTLRCERVSFSARPRRKGKCISGTNRENTPGLTRYRLECSVREI